MEEVNTYKSYSDFIPLHLFANKNTTIRIRSSIEFKL